MKALVLFLLMALSSPAFSDSTATERVWFDGGQETSTVNLSTEKTRTEYRTVTVPSTCYRTEYRHQCRWTPGHCRSVCRNGRCRRVCSPGRRICRSFPVRVPYHCERTVRESYQVFDYYVNTTVNVGYELENISAPANEEFLFSVTGKDLSLTVADSKNYLVLKKAKQTESARSGDTLEQTFNFNIDFVPAVTIEEALGGGIQNVVLNNGILRFSLGKSFNLENFVQNLKVYNSRVIISDVLLLDKDLKANEMEISTDGDLKTITVDLNKLGIELPSRMRVIMTTSFNPKGATIMNKDSFELQTSANWLFTK